MVEKSFIDELYWVPRDLVTGDPMICKYLFEFLKIIILGPPKFLRAGKLYSRRHESPKMILGRHLAFQINIFGEIGLGNRSNCSWGTFEMTGSKKELKKSDFIGFRQVSTLGLRFKSSRKT